jgi:hypothetical protein
MAKTFPVGHIRINPNTYMSEVWNGSTWIDTVTPQMVNSISTLGLPIGSAHGITTTVGSNGSSATLSRNMEDVFEFLKQNLRVAEYVDKDGKINTVQLEMRLGPGYTWDNIKRVKI